MDPMGMDINQSSSGWRTAMKVVLKVIFHTARCNQIGSTNQELRSPTETCSPVGEERPGFHPNYRFYETIIHRNIKKTGDDQLVGGSKSTNQTNLINVQNKQWSPHEKGKQQLESKSFETPTTNICRLQTLFWITRVCFKKNSMKRWVMAWARLNPPTLHKQLATPQWYLEVQFQL